MTDKKLYDFTQTKPFKRERQFPALKEKTIGELSDAECLQAHEDWIRMQFGHMGEYHKPHISALLHIIDELRAKEKAAPEYTTQVGEAGERSR